MNNEYKRILNLAKDGNNKTFIQNCFQRIQGLDFSADDFVALTNVSVANEVIKKSNRYTYPIVVAVAIDGDIPLTITHVKGRRRYYNDRFCYKGNSYLLCNDWYYPAPEKKNTKDTCTPFVEWLYKVEMKLSRQNSIYTNQKTMV